jgi:DNA-binding transcriptional MocR family regulator
MSPRYQTIADTLRQAIEAGALRPGERLISSRRLAAREQVSLPTAVEALQRLEAEGWIVARPRSGYFVRNGSMKEPGPSRPSALPLPVTMSGLARSLFGNSDTVLLPLGAALPDPTWLPTADLLRTFHAAGRRLGPAGQSYSMPPGRKDLRRQIAARAANWGGRFGPDDLVMTSGATQAVRLALQAVCKPGDIVAIEQPAYFGTLLLFENLGLRALEIETDPDAGIRIDRLAEAIDRHKPSAVLVSPTVQNPLGACMPAENKQALVALVERMATPLIEDDVYGDLAGDRERPPACKAYDRTGNVLYCSSVSKTLAPGWRVGWIAAGRFHDAVLQGRLAGDWAGAPVIEAALADFLASGDYDRHLRRLKPKIAGGVRAVSARVEETFPASTRVSRPRAGFLLWIELPPQVDALEVHARARALGIGVSPGHLFSSQSVLSHHLRLNCANEPTPRLLRAVGKLGEICCELANSAI